IYKKLIDFIKKYNKIIQVDVYSSLIKEVDSPSNKISPKEPNQITLFPSPGKAPITNDPPENNDFKVIETIEDLKLTFSAVHSGENLVIQFYLNDELIFPSYDFNAISEVVELLNKNFSNYYLVGQLNINTPRPGHYRIVKFLDLVEKTTKD
ncbi:MAG: hypothetical protein JXB25_08420, partial [Deltaproteobacteria bacterium]|nr:hypothetical protein [Deltaproteobacteria bacterium]